MLRQPHDSKLHIGAEHRGWRCPTFCLTVSLTVKEAGCCASMQHCSCSLLFGLRQVYYVYLQHKLPVDDFHRLHMARGGVSFLRWHLWRVTCCSTFVSLPPVQAVPRFTNGRCCSHHRFRARFPACIRFAAVTSGQYTHLYSTVQALRFSHFCGPFSNRYRILKPVIFFFLLAFMHNKN